jgi:hypothetical protein
MVPKPAAVSVRLTCRMNRPLGYPRRVTSGGGRAGGDVGRGSSPTSRSSWWCGDRVHHGGVTGFLHLTGVARPRSHGRYLAGLPRPVTALQLFYARRYVRRYVRERPRGPLATQPPSHTGWTIPEKIMSSSKDLRRRFGLSRRRPGEPQVAPLHGSRWGPMKGATPSRRAISRPSGAEDCRGPLLNEALTAGVGPPGRVHHDAGLHGDSRFVRSYVASWVKCAIVNRYSRPAWPMLASLFVSAA